MNRAQQLTVIETYIADLKGRHAKWHQQIAQLRKVR